MSAPSTAHVARRVAIAALFGSVAIGAQLAGAGGASAATPRGAVVPAGNSWQSVAPAGNSWQGAVPDGNSWQ